MIARDTILQLANDWLANPDSNRNGSYLVDVGVSAGNKITVVLDNLEGTSISECVDMSRWIEKHLDRDAEDFSLEVTSPGLDQPFRVFRQYEKNLGREVEVKLMNGQKVNGKLVRAAAEHIEVEQSTHERIEGKKGRHLVTKSISLPFSEIKETRIVIKF
ncbi:MAG TPA: ribosome assembly cofactor RimP [Bacteroidia bacterium]|nr:ribosome assembly cofactor RimP [Bacteroidia bacterium]